MLKVVAWIAVIVAALLVFGSAAILRFAATHSLAATPALAAAECFSAAEKATHRVSFRLPDTEVCGAVEDVAQMATQPFGAPLPRVVPDMPRPVYPLGVSPNGRYLVDANGRPFLIIGDSPQALIGALSPSDAELFLANRKAAGFNTVWVNLLCNNYTGCNGDGSTFDGVHPFVVEGDLSTPNEAYFARVDDTLRLADRYGFLVFLDPIETGGWLDVLRHNGTARAYDYGLYLGKRYHDVPNLVWMSGNDFQSWHNADDDALVLAVARGIHDADPTHVQTIELDYNVSASLDDARWAPLIQVDLAYSYLPTYAVLLREYNRKPPMPVIMIEANYEFEHNFTPEVTSPPMLRRQEYWTMLSGAAGQFYGNRYTWQFISDWQQHLDTVGSIQVGYLLQLFASRPWYDLVPDQDHRVVTAGYGTFVDDGGVQSSDYLTAARTSDGGLVITYMPTLRTISIDMSTLRGPARAQWFDPSRATYTPAAGDVLPNSGVRDFTPPGKNADGDGDWVLVLDAS